MKPLCSIAVLLLVSCTRALGDAADDERELTKLVKDIHAAIVKADVAFLERVLHADYTHIRSSGAIENRAQYLENRKTGRVALEALTVDEIKVRLYGDTAIVTTRGAHKGKDQQGAFESQVLVTRVFLRRDGRWQLATTQGTSTRKP
jgi:hypothetical protein